MSCIRLLLLGLLLCAAPLAARAAAQPTSTSDLTQAVLETKLKEIETAEAMDAKLKEQLVSQYKIAIAKLQSEAGFVAAAAEFKQRLVDDPRETHDLRAKITSATETAGSVEERRKTLEAELARVASMKELEQRVAKLEAELTRVRATVTQLETTIEKIKERPVTARKALSEAKAALDEIVQEQQKSVPADLAPPLVEVRRIVLQCRSRARHAEVEALNQELLANNVRLDRLTAECDLAKLELVKLEAENEITRQAENRRRLEEARRAQEETERAEREARLKHTAVQAIAEKNSEWSAKLAEIGQAIQKTTGRIADIQARTQQQEKEFAAVRQRLRAVGINDLLGRILSRQRRELNKYLQGSAARRDTIAHKEIAGIELERIEVEERLTALAQREASLQAVFESTEHPVSAAERAVIAPEIERALDAQAGLLTKLLASQRSYLDEMATLDFEKQRLLAAAQAYARFLDERLLWMRSTEPINVETMKSVGDALVWITAPGHWQAFGLAALDSLGRTSWLGGLLLVVAILLILGRHWVNRAAIAVRSRVGRIQTDRIGLTIQALLLDVLVSIPVPAVIVIITLPVRNDGAASEAARALAGGLAQTALWLFVLLFMRRLLRQDGIAQGHFRWPSDALACWRNKTIWMLAWCVIVPAVFCMATLDVQLDDEYRASLGRLADIASLLTLAAILAILFHPGRGLPAGRIRQAPNGWTAKLRRVWYPLFVLSPVALAVAAALGYYYAARVLGGEHLVQTLVLVFSAVVLQNFMRRWIYITYRRLAWEQALAARVTRHADAVEAGTESATASAGEMPEEPVIDLVEVNAQTRHLVRFLIDASVIVGLWLIWSPVLPALNVLDDVHLWQDTAVIDGKEGVAWITLNHLLLTATILVITFLASRNLPGALELTILKNLPIAAGGRYAMTTVCQYLIVGLGVVLAFNAIGIGWAKVQWLIAAMSLGLGFGLQEIFANFVSGLIILFERPIRVGDIITIGDVSGQVARIRIRATTVRDWDRKELVVPNKEFITGRLLNWTLTDAINRIVINVGIAYGSDTERARKLLLEVARSHPETMDDPAPFATFEGFGDSSLALVLRCYLPNLQNRLEVVHELHTKIDRVFKEAGIEIAFPQRDLHLRTVPAGTETLVPATPREKLAAPATTQPTTPARPTQSGRRSGIGPATAPDSEISDGM